MNSNDISCSQFSLIQECQTFEKNCPDNSYLLSAEFELDSNDGDSGFIKNIKSLQCKNAVTQEVKTVDFDSVGGNLRSVSSAICRDQQPATRTSIDLYNGITKQSPVVLTNGLQNFGVQCNSDVTLPVNPNITGFSTNVLSRSPEVVTGFKGITGIPSQFLNGVNERFPTKNGIISMIANKSTLPMLKVPIGQNPGSQDPGMQDPGNSTPPGTTRRPNNRTRDVIIISVVIGVILLLIFILIFLFR